MTIDIKKENNDLTVIPVGRLDSTTAGALDEVLKREINTDTTSLTVNMSGVDFISSMGLRVLVAAYQRLGVKVVNINGANASVLEVLSLSGLDKIFRIAQS